MRPPALSGRPAYNAALDDTENDLRPLWCSRRKPNLHLHETLSVTLSELSDGCEYTKTLKAAASLVNSKIGYSVPTMEVGQTSKFTMAAG